MESIILALLGIIITVVVLITLIKKIGGNNSKDIEDSNSRDTEDNNLVFWQYVQFTKKNIVTPTELKFFHTLTQALQGFYIFPQVATHAILDCSASPKKGKYSTTASVLNYKYMI